MSLAFVDRTPSDAEIEIFRLILSTYQDGSGMLKRKDHTLPGWRDFERTVAATFAGQNLESKWIYDVILGVPENDAFYGVSCKMRGTLREVERKGRVTIELSNAAGEFWDSLKVKAVMQDNFHDHSEIVGATLIEVVEKWHQNVSVVTGGIIDNSKSFFLSLQWEEQSGRYQLFQYPIDLPSPENLRWESSGRRVTGYDETGVLIEWYGLSGGQLKYYPLTNMALWKSDIFRLEPLPESLEHSLRHKAATYFPDPWQKISSTMHG